MKATSPLPPSTTATTVDIEEHAGGPVLIGLVRYRAADVETRGVPLDGVAMDDTALAAAAIRRRTGRIRSRLRNHRSLRGSIPCLRGGSSIRVQEIRTACVGCGGCGEVS
jgi:hypothetical protein